METPGNSQRNFLALTALEEFWDTARPMYFLGEWCRKYLRKEYWSKLDAIIIEPTQFKNKGHYEYHLHAVSVYEKLILQFSIKLNEFHDVQHSLKYWRHLIGPFLFWYVQIIYDRFLYLQFAYEKNPSLETFGLSHDCYFTPLNTNEFMCFSGNMDSYNLQLFTQLLDLKFKRPVRYKKITREKEYAHRDINYQKIKYKYRTRFILFLARILNKLFMGKNIGILGSGFSFKEIGKIILSSRFRILPVYSIKPLNRGQALGYIPPTQRIVDMGMRKKIFNVLGDDFLSQLVIDTLPINMPLIFIECYQEQVKLSKSYFPFNCAVILNEQLGMYDQYKFWFSAQMEKGAKLVGHQHGGGYGMQKGHPSEWIECDVSDFFVSWGWSYSCNIITAPVIQISRQLTRYYRNKNKAHLNRIVWVATIGGAFYTTGFCNWLLTQESYLSDQKTFFANLKENIASQVYMRASPTANSNEQVSDYLKDLKIYFPKNRDDFFSDIDNAKIVVLDHVGTSFLFVLAFNIPTILFWDKKYFPLCDEAAPYFKALEQAGIYYDSPYAAAAHLNKISENLYSWWNSESVQSARQQFCDFFARTSPNYLNEWSDILLNLYKGNKNATKEC